MSIPKRIPNHEKSYINLIRICENVVATGLDELPVGFNNRTSVERFLLKRSRISWLNQSRQAEALS